MGHTAARDNVRGALWLTAPGHNPNAERIGIALYASCFLRDYSSANFRSLFSSNLYLYTCLARRGSLGNCWVLQTDKAAQREY